MSSTTAILQPWKVAINKYLQVHLKDTDGNAG